MKGSIKKRGKTYMYIVDIGPDPITGKRRQKSKGGFKTKKETQKALALFLAELEKGMYIDKDIFMKDLFNEWLMSKNGIRHSTFISYTGIVNNYLTPYFGNVKVKSLKSKMLNDYYHNLLSSGLSSTTALYHHKILKQILKFAVNNDYVYINMSDRVEAPLKNYSNPTILSDAELEQFVNTVRGTELEAVCYIALGTGLRRGEILGLKFSTNINFTNNTISVTNSLTRTKKGVDLSRTKTKSSVRLIPIGITLANYLKQLKQKYEQYKGVYGDLFNDEDYVICWPNGNPYRPDYVTNAFSKMIKNSSLPHDFQFKNIRHQHASLLLRLGIPAKIIQERLGHSNIGTTMDIYSHLMPTMQSEAANQFEKEIFSRLNI